jgi:hypothetical protein
MGLSAFNLKRRMNARVAEQAVEPVKPDGGAQAPPIIKEKKKKKGKYHFKDPEKEKKRTKRVAKPKKVTCVKGCDFVAANPQGLQHHKMYCVRYKAKMGGRLKK